MPSHSHKTEAAAQCELGFQILDTHFAIRGSGRRIPRVLQFLPVGARHAEAPRHHHVIELHDRGHCYEIKCGGSPPEVEFGRAGVFGTLVRKIGDSALDSAAPGVSLLAGSADLAGRRVLFAGESRFMESSLALRLIMDGHNVESDTYTYVNGSGCRGLAFRIMAGNVTQRDVPEFWPLPPTVPRLIDEWGVQSCGVTPADLGAPWRVAHRPIDAVFFLEVNIGGETRVMPRQSREAIEMLIRDAVAWRASTANWIGPLVSALRGVRYYRLTVGGVAEAARAMTATMANPRPPPAIESI